MKRATVTQDPIFAQREINDLRAKSEDEELNHRMPEKKYKYVHISQANLNLYTSQFYDLFRARYGDYAADRNMKASRKFPPFTASPRDHIQRMAEKFARWIDGDPDFCARIARDGVEHTCTPGLLNWLSKLCRVEQYEDHRKSQPTHLYVPELWLLKFADTRSNGLLMPLTVDHPASRQKQILSSLVHEKYLEESNDVAAASDICRTADSGTQFGLQLTDLGKKRLTDLTNIGWFVPCETNNPLCSCRQVGEVHYNLEITRFGRSYVSDWEGGRNFAPDFIEGEDGDWEYLRAPTPNIEEILDGNELKDHLPFVVQLLEKFETEGKVEEGMANAFRLFLEGVLNQQEIAAEVGTSDTTISRWKETFKGMLVDPAFRRNLRMVAEANKPK